MAFTDRLHNRGSISTGYNIDYSLKFETDNTEYLMAEGRPQGTQTTWTWSCWLKRTEVDNGTVAQYIFSAGSDGKTGIYFRDDASYPDDRIFIYVDEGNSLKWIGQVNQSFRDTSAWYHIVFAVDSTDSTAADRTKIYVNGVQQTITFNATLNQNVSTRVGDGGGKFSIGGKVADTGYGFNGYMAECVLVDGSALTPTSFGEFDEDSNIWKPKDVSSLSLGTAGFHMNFDDSSNVGAVKTGTSQGNFDKYNLSAADQATDTPTNNFCTLNPLIYDINSGDDESYICFNGATSIAASKNAYAQNYATIGLNIASGGKWYFEWTATSTANGSSSEGLCGLAFDTQWNAGLNSTGVYNADFAFYAAGFGHGEGYGANVVNGLLIDLDNNQVKWYRDGTLHVTMPDGTDAMQTSGYAFPYIAPYGSGYTINANFGGYTAQTVSSGNTDPDGYGNFEYPTQGGYAICTKNLEEYG